MGLIGKPSRVFKNSNGDWCFEVLYKNCGEKKIKSMFFSGDASATSVIESAMKRGLYVNVNAFRFDLIHIDGKKIYSVSGIKQLRKIEVDKDLWVDGMTATHVGKGVYQVRLQGGSVCR
ncbi:MAG: hypothetical protein J6V90_08135 [Treponema sp.]|nr:hypothetical protein [Treponema sp.]